MYNVLDNTSMAVTVECILKPQVIIRGLVYHHFVVQGDYTCGLKVVFQSDGMSAVLKIKSPEDCFGSQGQEQFSFLGKPARVFDSDVPQGHYGVRGS